MDGVHGHCAYWNDVMVLCLDGLARLLRLLVRAGSTRRDIFPVEDRTSAACVLSPWVDERFVLTLPLVILVRGISAALSRAASVNDSVPTRCSSSRLWHLIAV